MMNDKSHAAAPLTDQVRKDVKRTIANTPYVSPAEEIYKLHPELRDGNASTMRQSRRSEPCETIEQHLKRLYPTEYTKIITNATKDAGPEHTASLLGYYAKGVYAKPLEVMFLWANTPEGHAFWKALSESEAI